MPKFFSRMAILSEPSSKACFSNICGRVYWVKVDRVCLSNRSILLKLNPHRSELKCLK